MTRTRFQNVTIVSGTDALDELRSGVGERVLVVSGKHVEHDPQLRGRVTNLLGPRLAGWEVVEPFPSEASVTLLLKSVRARDADAVVAIGGGSVIDAAKTAAVLAPNALTVRDAMAGRIGEAVKKLTTVAVPTLAGTGSEVTPFAVLYADGKKFSLESPLLQPDLVLSDPDLILLPPAPPASAGLLDALAQAVESLWAVRATAESEEHARGCLADIMQYFSETDAAACRAVLAGLSLKSGMAIGVSRTTAAHALSYPLTIRFGVPHGVACAAMLPGVLAWNAETTDADCLHPRGSGFVRERVAELGARVTELGGVSAVAARLGVQVSLRAWGVTEQDVGALAAACANPERLNNNPRRVTGDVVRALYQGAL